DKIYFHSIIPISFFLMILALHECDFSNLKPLRFIAYYSYNWYLWHPLFVFWIKDNIGDNLLGLFSYLLLSFMVSVVATILIEEPALAKRNIIISKIIKN
ncbi:MAG: hypothetical protein NZ108_05440, partial [Bacteroidia bacterium]|nr:hypothetical protein [Bacteroidia bacterium]